MARLPFLLALTAACVAGDPDDPTEPVPTTDVPGPQGIQVGDEGAFGCTVSAVTSIDDVDAIIDDLGMSAADALAGLDGPHTGTATVWDAGTVDPFVFNVAGLDVLAVAWVETGGPGGDPSPSCTPYLTVGTDVDVDGAPVMSATFPATITVSDDRATLSGAATLTEVTGSLEPELHDPSSLQTTEWRLVGEATAIGWEGFVAFSGCGADGACTPPADIDTAELSFSVTPTP